MNRNFVFDHQQLYAQFLRVRRFLKLHMGQRHQRQATTPKVLDYVCRGEEVTAPFACQDRQSAWSRTASTLNKWLWGALCCGLPGVPCKFCSCCERLEDGGLERERPRVNQSTATVERMARPHRPHAPRGRKHTPETLSAVRCALSQLQGEPAMLPVLPEYQPHSSELG